MGIVNNKLKALFRVSAEREDSEEKKETEKPREKKYGVQQQNPRRGEISSSIFMEKFSHSRNQTSSALSKKICNGNGFSDRSAYDDVFGGPPKFGVPTISPRVEDYTEIFGSFHASRASSIPVLDLPAVDEADVFFDVQEVDYSDIFGGFRGLDFAVSYDELLGQSKDGDDSSEEAWEGPCAGSSARIISPSRSLIISSCLRIGNVISVGAVQYALPRLVSGHAPILLDGEGIRRGLTPFRFKIMWLKEEGFKDLLKSWWERLKNVGGVDDIDDLALDFGCKEGNVPSSYLGLPLGSSFKFVATWDGVKGALWNQVISGSMGKEGVVFLGGYKGVWCWFLENYKEGLGSCEWTPAETGSLSEESDYSGKNESMSYGDAHQSFDDGKDFNISFHKANQRSKGDMSNGAHVTQLDAVPGYTVVVDGTPLQKTNYENPPLWVTGDISLSRSFGGGKIEEKHLWKTMSYPQNSNDGMHTFEIEPQVGYGENGSHSSETFITVSEISLRTQPSPVPPPLRPPPIVDVKKGDSSRSASQLKANKNYAFEGTAGGSSPGSSPPFFDVEVDASSSAAASAAAMKEAMEKAQAKLKNAKEIMERRKEGLQSRTKLGSRNDTKHKEGKLSSISNSLKDEKVQGSCETPKDFVREASQKEMKTTQVLSDSREGEAFLNVAKKSAEGRHGKESWSSQESYKTEGTGKWKEATEFMNLQKEKRAAIESFEQQEESDKKTNAAQEAHGWEENEAKEACRHEEHEKVEVAHVLCGWKENEKTWRVGMEHEEAEHKLNVADEWEEHDILIEIQQKQNEVEVKEAMKQENERKLKEAKERTGNERKLKKARENEKALKWQENEKKKKEAREREENERRLKVALDWEENEKKQKEACEREENEKRLKQAIEQEENEKRLKEALKQEQILKKQKEACEREENDKRLKEALEHEENEKKQKAHEKRLKEACEREEIEKKLKDAREREEIEKRRKDVHRQAEDKRRLNKTHERKESEKRLEEMPEWEETDKRLKEATKLEESEKRPGDSGDVEELKGLKKAHDQIVNENEKKLKSCQGTYAQMEENNFKATDEACKLHENKNIQAAQVAPKYEVNSLEANQEALGQEEKLKIAAESQGIHKDFKAVEMENILVEEIFEASGMADGDAEQEKNKIRMDNSTGSVLLDENVKKSLEAGIGIGIGQAHLEKNLRAAQMASNPEDLKKNFTSEWGEGEKSMKQTSVSFEPEDSKDKFRPSQVLKEWVENGKKVEAAQTATLEGKGNIQKTAQQVSNGQSTEKKEKNINETPTLEEREREERMKRERELEKDRLRKLEEEREREREREKDRMAVDRATREARDRAYVEARERAERAAVEKATAEARQRALTEARERLEKACAEAREKTLSDKTSIEARLRAERAAVERATAEARERAFEKAMAEKAVSDARERMERSVSDKFSASSRNSGLRQSSSSSDLQDLQSQSTGSSSGSRYPYSSVYGASYNTEKSEGVEGESAQRCKARLERYRRTADRAAKALAEKNKRDLLAQREQAERNRLAETLDADVKRWSSGKKGTCVHCFQHCNIMILSQQSIRQILGPDSGWQPIPLTDVITAVAVKKAYRKATLCVHPDKLQQRGASIQQKYICEKVFDLLKASKLSMITNMLYGNS
ncbi:Auxilin-like protein 1 [Vitis vinifera]|uniref:Auxilin-like protein 1 n=1 Tax=Vitis vinifera TaxID=29760 RepID=A0A438K5W4_VITVI|nr:Auxilin-like protein 1 [Vitis vinifera]